MSVALAVCVSVAGAARAADAPDPRADYDVKVELRNVSGEKKTNWPVILTVFRIFGRNIPAGTLNPKGYHVYNEKGEEIEHTLEQIPPYAQQGNNELVFIIPEMERGQALTYRITNTAENSDKRTDIDFVNNPNNLLANPGFEKKGDDGPAAGWTGDGKLVTDVKRSGRTSLLMSGLRRRKVKYAEDIPLHKGSPYYFGIWGKTDHVARHALSDSKGGYFKMDGFDAEIQRQCATRDWWKSHFITTTYSDWGVPDLCAKAAADSCPLFFISMDQRPQFVQPNGHCEGKWWLDDATLFEQPEVRVRFDLLLESHVKDGLFIFSRPTNMNMGSNSSRVRRYCSMPYPREKLVGFDRSAVKGQRVPLLLGLYARKPLRKARVSLQDGLLTTADGLTLPLTEIEYCEGYLGPDRDHILKPHNAPVTFRNAPAVPYFVASFLIPRQTKAGKYKGTVNIDANGRRLRSIPVTLRVQDMELPVLRDVAVAGIFQGRATRLVDSALKQYAKSGYTAVTRFGSFFRYKRGPDRKVHIDLDHLARKLKWLAGYGITAGVTPFSDVDLGPLWGGGQMIKRLKTKKAFLREVKRVEDFSKKNPELPRIIWMTWDEPIPNDPFVLGTPREKGSHGGANPRMGWPNEACPDAWTTIDAGFWIWDKILPYYTYPNFDEPANYCGPELYEYTLKHGTGFGFAGEANAQDERARYQVGIMLIASGAKNFQFWHVAGSYPEKDGGHLRALYTVATGEGLDDLKIHRLLKDAIKKAKAAGDRAAAVREAEKYLDRLFKVWDADHCYDESHPYLGLAGEWGYDQFYEDWQETMLRHAAKLRGIDWVK
jgi:hypothetical protein